MRTKEEIEQEVARIENNIATLEKRGFPMSLHGEISALTKRRKTLLWVLQASEGRAVSEKNEPKEKCVCKSLNDGVNGGIHHGCGRPIR